MCLEAEVGGMAPAYLAFPATHRTKIRTNNVQEANCEISAGRASCRGSRASRSSAWWGAALIEADFARRSRRAASSPYRSRTPEIRARSTREVDGGYMPARRRARS